MLTAKVVATVRAIDRKLRDAGCDWHDLTSALASKRGKSAPFQEPPAQAAASADLARDRRIVRPRSAGRHPVA
jgi:hypothetical protein